MSISTQARALGTAGATFRRAAMREATHTAITYRARDAAESTTLATAYFSEIGSKRDGDAGMQELAPDAELSVLRTELAAPAIGALIVQGSDRYRITSSRHAPGGVEWVLALERAT